MKRLAVALSLISLVACEAEVGDMVSETLDLAPAPVGAVEAGFRVGPVANGLQTVWVRLTGAEGQVGSYQGSLRFDASKFTLVSAAMTDSEGTGDFGILNDEMSAEGSLRFAGFSVAGFDVRDVIELQFRTRRPLEAGEIEVSLDVVGTIDGAAVPESDLSVASAMLPMTELELAH